jgi:beta-aspartyl-peptidase (threonine type)
MNTIAKKTKKRIFQFVLLFLCFFIVVIKTQAQAISANDGAAKEIISAMENSANEWNKGNLDAFMNLYDPSATMMMSAGPVGLDAIRSLYENKYFNGGMPKQNLRYTDMKVRLLGSDYALLTGAFTLYGNNLPERSGRYSLVMIHTANGWKILHDHSG